MAGWLAATCAGRWWGSGGVRHGLRVGREWLDGVAASTPAAAAVVMAIRISGPRGLDDMGFSSLWVGRDGPLSPSAPMSRCDATVFGAHLEKTRFPARVFRWLFIFFRRVLYGQRSGGPLDREYAGGSASPVISPPLSSLVGRQRELGELDALLRRTRMLTLTGTGGSGKTRLSLALAEVSRGRFRHGAWWVDLSNVTSDEFIAGAVASALDIAQSPGRDTAAGIARHLQTRAALLIFDNCEQVVRGCAGLLQLLLTACPDVSVIATSREVLGVSGEVVFPVAGLRLPARDDDTTAEAVELFIERARAMTPGFTVAPANREAVVRLCRQLDGLPLAIELAAARAGILGVAEIARPAEYRTWHPAASQPRGT